MSANLDAVDRRQVAWCVVIFGLPYRYYSRVAPGSDVDDGKLYDYATAPVFTPTDVDAVLDVGPIRAQWDDLGGLAVHEPVEVSILARGARTAAGVRNDPYQTLMRVAGHHAADFAARLTTSLDHSLTYLGPATIEIDKSASGLITWPRAFHIGQEVIWADSWTDPGGGVHQLTDCTRAADGHVSQAHIVSDDPPEQPWVTSDVVTWHGRRAAVYVSALDASGDAIGWAQYWSGFLDSAPEMSGDVITLRIAPLTRVLRHKLGVGSAARAAKAVTGAHFFTAGVGDGIAGQMRWNPLRANLEAIATGGGGTTVTLSAPAAAIIDALGVALDVQWQTHILNTFGASVERAVSYASPVLTFAAASPLVTEVTNGLIAGQTVWLYIDRMFAESYKLRLIDPVSVEEVVAWPERLTDVVNIAQAWQPGPIDSWADPDGAGGEDRLARLAIRRGAEWTMTAWVKDIGGAFGLPTPVGGFHIRRGHLDCYAGVIIGETVDNVRRVPWAWRADGGYKPVDFGADGVYARDEHGNDRHAIAIPGAAEWWYQSGETYIGPFDRDIYNGGGMAQTLMLTGPALPMPAFIPIVASQSVAHPSSGETVYFYTVKESHRNRSPCVVKMAGDGPIEAVVIASDSDTEPAEFLLRLLMSGTGNQDNGAYDTLPIGANLPTALVREHTFTRASTPVPLRRQDYAVARGKSIIEQMDGLLMASGAQVVSRFASTSWQLELEHTGPADVRLSVMSITDDDIRQTTAPVETVIDGRVVRSFTLKLNYSAVTQGDPTEVPVELASERADGGSDSGSPVELDLPGVYVSGSGSMVQAAAEIVADMRARVGTPRVRWRFAIRADKPGALELGIGDVVTLTTDYAFGVNPTAAVASVPCRVVGLMRDLEENRLELEVRPFGGVTSGYVPAMVVASVVDLDTVTVQASNLSDDDPSWFEQGDPVDCIPAGNWAGRTATTIASKAGTTINFAANHGLAVGDTIRMRDYDTVIAIRAMVGQFAYLADDTDEIGAGGADGRVIG